MEKLRLVNYYLKAIDNTWDVGGTREQFVNHLPAARDLQILLVFYQNPAWFISLQAIETCGLLRSK